MKKVELLAPAGERNALIAAVQNGADAVYVGGRMFGARANASNFYGEELCWAVDYCHLRGVKLYMTVNTLVRDSEMPEVYEMVREAVEGSVTWTPPVMFHASHASMLPAARRFCTSRSCAAGTLSSSQRSFRALK